MPVLHPRYDCTYIDGDRYCSPWGEWGRWVALGIIIFVTILFFFLWACISARRRRRRGMQPMYGTGWAAHNFGNQQQYPPPPQYTANATDQQTWGQNPNYYGPQGGVELQQPQNVYQAPGTGPTTTGTTPGPYYAPSPQPQKH